MSRTMPDLSDLLSDVTLWDKFMDHRGPPMRERWKQLLFVGTVSAALIVAASLLWSGRSSAQAMPVLLEITAPAEGTVVNPGQTVTFVVTPISGGSFTSVLLDGPYPFSASPRVSVSPYQLSLAIPQKIAAGKYAITAFGARSGQNAGVSKPIHLDVEPSTAIVSMRIVNSTIVFQHAGDKIPVRVWGTFSDGSTMEITKSSGTTYSTGNPKIATVNAIGWVTAVGHDTMSVTPINITYANQTATVQVSTMDLPPDSTP